MKTVIISDAHLKFFEKQEDKERREKILAFLRSLEGNTQLLIINGDFFDLWFAWKQVIIRNYFEILCLLRGLVQSGMRIVFLAGNHDFWFNGFLQKNIGFEIILESYITEIEGKSFFIDHGDRYTRNDFRYQIYRFIIRNNLFKGVFQLFHPDLALLLGLMLSRSSRKRRIPPKKQEQLITGLRAAAAKKIARYNYDFVIFGHSHIPALEQAGSGIYANSGDWISHATYLVFENGILTLNEFQEGEI